jgi:hypothetical protein
VPSATKGDWVSSNGRNRRRKELLPAFQGEVQANPGEEEQGVPTALAMAIAEAAQEAASHLADKDLPETEFEVSRIEIMVAPNPGPTSYKATLTPKG